MHSAAEPTSSEPEPPNTIGFGQDEQPNPFFEPDYADRTVIRPVAGGRRPPMPSSVHSKLAASLTLTILRCPHSVTPEARNVSGGEFTVGRGPEVDWVLPDPERLLSKRHFAVAFRGGGWQITDTSVNGTFLNRETDAIGAGDMRSLHDGDRLRLGAYEIAVRLTADAIAHAGSSVAHSPFAAPFAMDDPFRPIEPDAHESPFRGPTQASAGVGRTPLHSDGIIPGDDLLPDDWDRDLLEGISPAAQPATAPQEPAPRTRPIAGGGRRAAAVAGGPPNKPPKHSTGGAPNGPRRSPGRPTRADNPSGALEAYLERLLKLIPAEVVSIYPVGRSLIDDDGQQGLWALICLTICVLFRARMTRGPDGRPQWVAIGIAAISFMIWVYVLGSHVPGLSLPAGYKVWPALMLLVWTSLIPALYTGQRTPALPGAQPSAG